MLISYILDFFFNLFWGTWGNSTLWNVDDYMCRMCDVVNYFAIGTG